MRHVITHIALPTLLLLAACSNEAIDADDVVKKHEPSHAGGAGLALSPDQAKALGLTKVTLQAASYLNQINGYGTVVSFDVIAQADAELATAQANLAQSTLAAARAKELAGGDEAALSRETLEVATAKASVDQTAVLLAQRKIVADFGSAAPWNNAGQRSAILARLQAGRSVLVKVSFPLDATSSLKAFSVARLGINNKSYEAATVWDAPADPAFPGHSVFALIDNSDLVTGERVIASQSVGTAQQGVVVPAAAVLLGESDAWVYVQLDDTYLRTRIDISHPQGDGYFVATGLEPEQSIVTSGAGLLYAREINPSAEAD